MTPIVAGRPWLQTRRGLAWCADEPESFEYDIVEIAHAIANLCRFAGHTAAFYSVAQHSVLVSENAMVDGRTRHMNGSQILEAGRLALLHDAAEAFCIDLPSPIKHMLEMAGYRRLIERTEAAIERHFASQLADPGSINGALGRAIVKHADLVMLATEKRDVLGPSPHDDAWLHLPDPSPHCVCPLEPDAARRLFLDAWKRCGGAA